MRATSTRHGKTGRKTRRSKAAPKVHSTRVRRKRITRKAGHKTGRLHVGHQKRAAVKAKRRLARKSRRHTVRHVAHRAALRHKRPVRHRKGRPSHNKPHRRRH